MGMKSMVYGQDARVRSWVAERVDEDRFQDTDVAIGIEEDGELIAGVVYNMYTGPSISMHVAAVPGKRWLTREFLFRFFAYPFIQLRCRRVTGLVREDNLAAQQFDEHIGFVREGLLRNACDDGQNMILYGMLREECRWLEIKR
jgi:RimJ/RimL family protein N-acetyltransferase